MCFFLLHIHCSALHCSTPLFRLTVHPWEIIESMRQLSGHFYKWLALFNLSLFLGKIKIGAHCEEIINWNFSLIPPPFQTRLSSIRILWWRGQWRVQSTDIFRPDPRSSLTSTNQKHFVHNCVLWQTQFCSQNRYFL